MDALLLVPRHELAADSSMGGVSVSQWIGNPAPVKRVPYTTFKISIT